MTNELLEIAAEGTAPSGIGIFIPAVYDIVWSLVPAALIFVFFWKYALPKFRQITDDRAAAIEGGIAKAEAAQAEAQALLTQYTAQLEQARTDANELREEARRDGQAILAELKEQAQNEAARILATAQAQIEADRQAALISLRAEVGTLALDLAGSVLGEKLSSDKAASAVVDRFLADLGSDSKVKAGK
jgi:F-type H+-transporting ATPase subunit b